MSAEPFAGFPLEQRITRRAAACGIALPDDAASALADHARSVLRANPLLHLTSVVDHEEFIERHVGESLEGAAMLDDDVRGSLVDLGSGNGYPGFVIAAARPRLVPTLVEASPGKADFLRQTLQDTLRRGTVLAKQVQRATDLDDLDDNATIEVLATRAMGAWDKILPRLASRITPRGVLLLWAGRDAEGVVGRKVWKRFRLDERRPLPGRDHSWIWRFSRA